MRRFIRERAVNSHDGLRSLHGNASIKRQQEAYFLEMRIVTPANKHESSVKGVSMQRNNQIARAHNASWI